MYNCANTTDVVKNFAVIKNAAVKSFHCTSYLCERIYELSLVANVKGQCSKVISSSKKCQAQCGQKPAYLILISFFFCFIYTEGKKFSNYL